MGNVKEEKAALEDVFKFDSELVTSEETATANNKPEVKMSTSLNYEDVEKEEENKEDVGGRENGLSQSLTSWATTTSTSESEVGNSPNPRATSQKKGKKKK